MKAINHMTALAGMALIFACSGCATPQPVARLHSIDKVALKTWSHGAEVITSPAQDSVQVSVAFRQSMTDYLVFEVTIGNDANKPVFVTPEKFYYELLSTDTTTAVGNRTYASDPEKALLEMDRRASRLEAAQRNATSLDETTRYDMSFQSLEDERRHWSEHSIRRNTLRPGYEMAGSVFFPRNNQGRWLRLSIVVENRVFPFTFQQVLHSPHPMAGE
ncbi:MAG TPA: hypothetical protein PKC76_16635 [Saprospiraceae bacterium]|nr:hypothetical protein [Saprospiraceae bacterium]HMP25761.1 hypothetical protein [Saprospiraceae bacterium]